MVFPFLPVGAIVAAFILVGALTIFVAALMAIDRTASRAAGSMLPGLVSGIHSWATERRTGDVAFPAGPASPDGDSVEPAQAIPVDRVRPTRR